MIQQEVKSTIMTQAATFLELSNGFMVPAKTLYTQLRNDPVLNDISFETFLEMLKGDSRFRVFDTDDQVMTELETWISRTEMEELGYYEGPRVMLKKRVPNEDEETRWNALEQPRNA